MQRELYKRSRGPSNTFFARSILHLSYTSTSLLRVEAHRELLDTLLRCFVPSDHVLRLWRVTYHCRLLELERLVSPLKRFAGTAGAPPATRRRRAGFELLIKFSRFALIAGEGARGPSKSLDRYSVNCPDDPSSSCCQSEGCKKFCSEKKAAISERRCKLFTPGRYSHPYQFTLLNGRVLICNANC